MRELECHSRPFKITICENLFTKTSSTSHFCIFNSRSGKAGDEVELSVSLALFASSLNSYAVILLN